MSPSVTSSRRPLPELAGPDRALERRLLSLLAMALVSAFGSGAMAQGAVWDFAEGSEGDFHWVRWSREQEAARGDGSAEGGGDGWDEPEPQHDGQERGSFGLALMASGTGGVTLGLPPPQTQGAMTALGGAQATAVAVGVYSDPRRWQYSIGYMGLVNIVGRVSQHLGLLGAQHAFDLGEGASLAIGVTGLAGTLLGGRANITYRSVAAPFLAIMVELGSAPLSDFAGNVVVMNDLTVQFMFPLASYFGIFFAPRATAVIVPANGATSFMLDALVGISLAYAWPV